MKISISDNTETVEETIEDGISISHWISNNLDGLMKDYDMTHNMELALEITDEDDNITYVTLFFDDDGEPDYIISRTQGEKEAHWVPIWSAQ